MSHIIVCISEARQCYHDTIASDILAPELNYVNKIYILITVTYVFTPIQSTLCICRTVRKFLSKIFMKLLCEKFKGATL